MSKKQTTLAAFGFTKSVTHRGQKTTTDLPKTVSEEIHKLKCLHVMQGLKNQQGLSVHLKCKHASITAEDQLPRSNEILCELQENETTSVPSAESVDKEVECVEILETSPSVERPRGSDVRKSINNRFKAKAIALVERGEKAIDVADRLSVTRGQISKWLKMKDKILNAAGDETKKMLTRVAYPSKKYNELYKALNLKFLDARSKGRCIDLLVMEQSESDLQRTAE